MKPLMDKEIDQLKKEKEEAVKFADEMIKLTLVATANVIKRIASRPGIAEKILEIKDQDGGK